MEAAADLLEGDDLKELHAYLASVCPPVLGLEVEGERSVQAFGEALETADASVVLSA